MGTTISGNVNGGVILDPIYNAQHNPVPATNPVLVTGTIIDSQNSFQDAYVTALRGAGDYVWNITNQGTIRQTASGGTGILLHGPGILNNSGLIQGTHEGINNIGTLTNSGTIVGGEFGDDSGGAAGALTNSATGLIIGGYAARIGAGRVINAGSIIGTAGYALRILGNGVVTNANGAVIEGISAPNATGFGIYIAGAGTLVNGDSTANTALIEGTEGVRINGTAGTVTNFGTITGTAGLFGPGIFMRYGSGIVANGNANATGRLISGQGLGVFIAGSGTVTNFGTIIEQNGTMGTGPIAVEVKGGGDVFNGTSASPGWLIQGSNDGVGDATNVTNYGTIVGAASFGIDAGAATGGTIVNSAVGLITGAIAARTGAALVTNAGRIIGTAGYGLQMSGTHSVVTNANGAVIEGISVPNGTGLGVGFALDGTLINGNANANTALIEGTEGVRINGTAGTVTNFGTIAGTAGLFGPGIFMSGSGIVANGNASATGRLISGQGLGVYIAGSGTVTNFGTIIEQNGTMGTGPIAVEVKGGGDVFNGSSASPGWLIQGSNDGVGGANNVTNYGTIVGAASFGIDAGSATGGTIINATVGLITGANAGRTGAALVTNAGKIVGTAGSGLGVSGTSAFVSNANGAVIEGLQAINATGYGVRFNDSGTLVNGDSSANTALVQGTEGVEVQHVGTVINFGTIAGTAQSGIFISSGVVANGNASATGRLISGVGHGVYFRYGSGTLSNFGTITASATSGLGIALNTGGDVVNGSSASPGGLIQGGNEGVVGATNLNNYGTIAGGAAYGLDGGSGGTVVNATTGLIIGAGGVRTSAASVANAGVILGTSGSGLQVFGTDALLTNTGTIQGITGANTAGFGARLDTGALINGGAAAPHALITGNDGVVATGAATITNFGTITGTAGDAIRFGGGDDRLIVEPGAVFSGQVDGGSGSNTLELAGGSGKLAPFGTSFVNFGSLLFDAGTQWTVEGTAAALPGTIAGFVNGDKIDLDGFVAVSETYNGNSLVLTDAGNNHVTLGINSNLTSGDFTIAADGNGGTLVGVRPAPSQSPAVLQDFGWQQGWGSPDNPRFTADLNVDGNADYLGFGFNAVFVGYGGTFSDGQGHLGPGFAATIPAVVDFGTNEGYTADVQRGAAATGAGLGDVLYGQGFAGVYWYAATSATPQTDAAGNTYQVLHYQSTPNLYGNFGSQQGWTDDNGFQILKTAGSDAFASILGFGNDGIVVGPQAFAPGATAANSYLIPFAAGNNSGWDQDEDIRTFTDASGKVIDLNKDGIADFVGMGPQGLAFAFGNNNGPGGSYQLGALQNAQINGNADDLGKAQGWTNSATLRYIVADPQTGFDDILAFGDFGVTVAMGQDPATHNGQPFGQLYLAMPDFGANQGWSVSQTPRIVGDVNGDGIPDIVGFGATSTFVALGSRDAANNLHFALAPTQTIGDFGYTEGWSGTNPQTIRALADFKTGGTTHSDLVLSGAFNTQVWQFG